jgi:hypothetical protein
MSGLEKVPENKKPTAGGSGFGFSPDSWKVFYFTFKLRTLQARCRRSAVSADNNNSSNRSRGRPWR